MPPQPSSQSLLKQQGPKPITIKHEAAQEPLRVAIESPTDWPTVIATLTVGLGSILTSLVVAYLSGQNQRYQVRSSIATLRSTWIRDLRQLSSDFIGISTRIGHSIWKVPGYLSTPEGSRELSSLYQAASQIELMLDPNKPETGQTTTKMEQVVSHLREQSFLEAESLLNEFKSDISRILEKAWGDVKDDLRNPGKSLEQKKRCHPFAPPTD